jgi:osmotically-inducible protein OsmY
MNRRLASLSALALGAFLTFSGPAAAWQDPERKQPAQTQATGGASDREITQQIRQALVADDSLSTNAKNVKVNVKNGKATLKGQVNSEDEKAAVELKAVKVAGDGNVDNQITVKGGTAHEKK